MHGTCVHQCLMAEPQLNAAEHAMNFCPAISLAWEASYQPETSQCGQDHAGDLCFVQYLRG